MKETKTLSPAVAALYRSVFSRPCYKREVARAFARAKKLEEKAK